MTDNELKEHCLQEAEIDLGRYSYNELNLIKDALRRYHNAKLKLLSISDVSGRSEQLVNFLLHLNDKELINNHDFDYENEAKKYLKKIN